MSTPPRVSCPICFGPLEDPVVIACGHTFCKCLKNLRPSDDGRFSCPLCKMPFESVDNLPKNYIVEAFLDELKTKSIPVPIFENQSQLCPTNCQNCKSRPATIWCSGCSGISYCQSCCAAVHTIPALKDHQPISFYEKLNTPNYLLCTIHPYQKKEIFCTECDVAICQQCKMDSHLQHTTICITKQSEALKSKLKEASQALIATDQVLHQEFKDCEAKMMELKMHLTTNQTLQRKLFKLAADADTRLLTAPGFENKVNKVVRRASASSSPSPRDSPPTSNRETTCPSPTRSCGRSPTRSCDPSRSVSPTPRSPRERAQSKKKGELISYHPPAALVRARGGVEDPWTWEQTSGIEVNGFKCKSTITSGWKMAACFPRSTEGRTEFKWRIKILTIMPPFIGSPSVMLGAISVDSKGLIPKAQYFNDGIVGGYIHVPLGTVDSSWKTTVLDPEWINYTIRPDTIIEFCWARWKSELEIYLDGVPIVNFSDLPPYIVPACAFYRGAEVVFV